MYNHCPLTAKEHEDPGQLLAETCIVDAHKLDLRAGWIGQWPQDIEDGAQSQLSSQRSDAFHGWMKDRGQHESDSHSLNHLSHRLGLWANVHSQLRENIGASAFRAYCIVPMLGHIDPAGSGDYSGCRAHIDGIGGIPARATCVHQSTANTRADLNRRVSHLPGKARNLGY
ncbi:Uncharacterised protein [uncultured archaeon]|nr:Uncharacterised protein [uncultured archaeon]